MAGGEQGRQRPKVRDVSDWKTSVPTSARPPRQQRRAQRGACIHVERTSQRIGVPESSRPGTPPTVSTRVKNQIKGRLFAVRSRPGEATRAGRTFPELLRGQESSGEAARGGACQLKSVRGTPLAARSCRKEARGGACLGRERDRVYTQQQTRGCTHTVCHRLPHGMVPARSARTHTPCGL